LSFSWQIVSLQGNIIPPKMSGAKKLGHEASEVTRSMVVLNKLGIHARPASQFVQVASRYHSEILVEKDGDIANGKSIMSLLMLAAGPGSRLIVRARGHDAEQAIRELEALVSSKFNEE
jgi:phosphocarrier protein